MLQRQQPGEQQQDDEEIRGGKAAPVLVRQVPEAVEGVEHDVEAVADRVEEALPPGAAGLGARGSDVTHGACFTSQMARRTLRQTGGITSSAATTAKMRPMCSSTSSMRRSRQASE